MGDSSTQQKTHGRVVCSVNRLAQRRLTSPRLLTAALLPTIVIVSEQKVGVTALLAILQCAALCALLATVQQLPHSSPHAATSAVCKSSTSAVVDDSSAVHHIDQQHGKLGQYVDAQNRPVSTVRQGASTGACTAQEHEGAHDSPVGSDVCCQMAQCEGCTGAPACVGPATHIPGEPCSACLDTACTQHRACTRMLGGTLWALYSMQLFFCTGHFCEFAGLQYAAGELACFSLTCAAQNDMRDCVRCRT